MQEVFLLPLATAALFSVSSTLDKFILENRMPNPTAYFFLQSFLAVIFFPLISILIFGLQWPSMQSFLLILLAAAAANTGYFVYFTIMKSYELSSVGPLIQTKLLFTIPLAFFFLREFYGAWALLLMGFIFAGAVLTTYSHNASLKALLMNNRLLMLAMLMSLSWALSDLPVRMVSGEISAASFVAWRYLLSAPIIAVFAAALFRKQARQAFSKNFARTIPFSLAATIVGFSGIMLLFMAYRLSYTIPSAVVLSQGMFLFAIAFMLSKLKGGLIAEKEPLKVYLVRLAGVLLISSSIWFLMNANLAL